MAQFSLRRLFWIITLVAIGVGGLMFRESELMPAGSQWVWLNLLVFIGSWTILGNALLLPFWRPGLATMFCIVGGMVLGLIGVAVQNLGEFQSVPLRFPYLVEWLA